MEEAPQSQPQPGGLFKKPALPVQADASDELHSLARRLRLLEERFGTLQKKEQLTEQNMLKGSRRFDAEIKSLNTELSEVRTELADMAERLKQVLRQLQSAARKEDVEVMRKYLSFWEPVQFVTQNQVERMVRELLEEALEGKEPPPPKPAPPSKL